MSYTFSWAHPASEVFVTGTFDNWSQSIQLDNKGGVHEKTVDLPAGDKILYKFVADGEWKHDHTAKSETDDKGNVNNVLYPTDLKSGFSGAALSSVAPGATSTSLAGQQPLESTKSAASHDSIPGAFPETPALGSSNVEPSYSVNPIPASTGSSNPIQLAAGEKVPEPSSFNANTVTSQVHDDPELKAADTKSAAPEESAFGVAPIPATSGIGNPVSLAPGEKVPEPSSFTNNTITSQVQDDPELKAADAKASAPEESTFGVAPIPATGGIGNPVHLEPGEKVPESSTLTGNTIGSNVKLDQASYEKADTSAPVLPAPLSPQSEKEAYGQAAIFGGLGPQTSNMIPESSMGMGKDTPAPIDDGPTISSTGPSATTASLAGQQPLEKREEKVAEPEANESNDKSKTVAEYAAGGLAAAGAAAAGTAYALRDKTTEKTGTDPFSKLPKSIQDSINSMNNKTLPANQSATSEDAPAASSTAADQSRETTATVPAEVVESQKEANFAPEASASKTAVGEKAQVEQELLSKVKESEASGEPAPTASAALSETAPTTSAEKSTSSAAPVAAATVVGAGAAATAGAAIASSDKPNTTAPQLDDPTTGVAPLSMDEGKGLNAPASAPAVPSTPPTTTAETLAPGRTMADSRDVSPMSKPVSGSTTGQTEPVVTTGVASSKAPAESKPVGTPRRPGAGDGSSTGKRNSFIDRLKGTPESTKTTSSAGGSPSGKKKGLFSRIKDKLK